MVKQSGDSKTPTNRKKRLFFTGLTMGTADLIPSVSSGTIAFIFGIYDELLYTIKLVTGHIPKLLLSGQFKSAVKLIPFGFLVPLAAGMILAIFGLVRLVSFLLDTQPTLIWALFFGLVLGSAYIVALRINKWNIWRSLWVVLGFVLTFLLVGLPSIGGSAAPLAVFATGAVAITAMVLPGISGSLIMVLLGQYEIVIQAVADLNLVLLGIFLAGALIGVALFVRLLTWLLKNYHMVVVAFLIGMMAGSLRRIWPWQTDDPNGGVSNFLPALDVSLILPLLLMAVGVGLILILKRTGIASEHDDIDTPGFKKDNLHL